MSGMLTGQQDYVHRATQDCVYLTLGKTQVWFMHKIQRGVEFAMYRWKC